MQVVSHVDPQQLCVLDGLHLSSIDIDGGVHGMFFPEVTHHLLRTRLLFQEVLSFTSSL